MDPYADAKHAASAPPLDPGLYVLDEKSTAFFKSTTGIQDDNELKEHIMDVQKQAYAVVPYPCIRAFGFTRLTITKNHAYDAVLKLGRECEGALFLDIGCCFGHDARKAALDGFPAKQIVASDLRRELWNLGHLLFCSKSDSFPMTFLEGDVFDLAFLSPFMSRSEAHTELDLSSVSTLNDLRGRVSAIWAASFFHLFTEKDQHRLARAVGSLLSPKSGSVILGLHVALPSKGHLTISDRDVNIFCHDPESWKEMWVGRSTTASSAGVDIVDDVDSDHDAAVFHPGSVTFDTRLVSMRSEGGNCWVYVMVWSIMRV